MKKIIINGRFLGRPVTGVERFGREILRALDSIIASSECPYVFEIVCPIATIPEIELANISITKFGERRGHAWEQIDLARFAKKHVLVSLANSGPILHKNQLAIIHDAAVFRNPQNYSFPYRTLHRCLGRLLARTSSVTTVSEFSRSELEYFLHPRRLQLTTIPNGTDHLFKQISRASILDQFGLRANEYFLAVGSTSKTKNLDFLISAWKHAGIKNRSLVIAGGLKQDVFGSKADIAQTEGIVLTGRVSDEALTALYANSALFIAPSLYEGFGIPPLEALAFGSPVLASDIPAHREICGDQVTYFDPRAGNDLAESLRAFAVSPASNPDAKQAAMNYASRHTWENSARRLIDCLRDL